MRTVHKYFMMIAKGFQHIFQNIYKTTEGGGDNKLTETGIEKITEDSEY